MNDVSYLPIGDLLASLPSDAVVRVLVPTAIEGGNAFDLKEEFVFANKLSASSLETITPVVTAGSGSVDDFSVMCYRLGNKIMYNGFCRTYIVADTETTTTVELTLPAAFAPASNFADARQIYGGASSSAINAGGNSLQNCTLSTVTGTKKLQISLGLTAAASSNFTTAVSFFGSIMA